MTRFSRFQIIAGASVTSGIVALAMAFAALWQPTDEAMLAPLFLLGFAAILLGSVATVRGVVKKQRVIVPLFGLSLGLAAVLGVVVLVGMNDTVACMYSQANLKQIGYAMHAHDSKEGRLPGPILDADGRPILSWRVRVLPYLEEDKLYKQFHLNEPWDSPHNLALLPGMPTVYRSPWTRPPHEHWTYYRLVVGTGTAFEQPGLTLADFRKMDGLHATMFILEAGEAVPWTKPEEWEYDPNGPLPSVGGIFHPRTWFGRRIMSDVTHVANGQAYPFALPRNTPEATWRALATRNGGEKIELP